MVALAALAAAAPAHADGPAAVRVAACETGDQPDQRSATFEGRMNSVKGAARMAMRFQLYEQKGESAPATAVAVGKLDRWHRSDRGVKRFVYAQTVKGLNSGVTYRSVVQYRWTDAKGRVVRTAQRDSGTCVQDGDLANLVLSSVRQVSGDAPGTAVYTVSVANTGRGDAHNFDVALVVDGALADSREVDELKAGESTTLKMTGPVCHRLRAVVDRDHAVAETVEEDNELRSRC